MIWILVAIVTAAIVAGMLFWYAGEGYGLANGFAGVAGVCLAIAAGGSGIIYAFTGWSWLAAEHKAHIINREYKTNYTREEIFYASDVIETVRELDRKRYEINGDLVKGSER